MTDKNNIPDHYFSDLEEQIWRRIETERLAPPLAQAPKTSAFGTNDLPTDYFDHLAEAVFTQIASENEFEYSAFGHFTKANTLQQPPKNYFDQLENAVFEQIKPTQKPIFTLTQTPRKTIVQRIIIGGGAVAAAVVVGFLFFSPNQNNMAFAETPTTAPISAQTQALFAEVSTPDAISFLKEHAPHLDDAVLEKHIQNTNNEIFTNIETQDISDFVNENDVHFD